MEKYLTAFRVLLNELVFINPLQERFPRKTIREISMIIQQQFIILFEGTQNEAKNVLREISLLAGGIEALDSIKVSAPTTYENYSFQQEIDSHSSDEEFLKTCLAFQVLNFRYSAWGFTPKLSDYEDTACLLLNCFGRSLLFGAFCRARGMNVDLGIGADHPHAIVHINNQAYTIDESSELIVLKGNFEDCNGYKTYRRHSSENIIANLLIVYSFDEAIVYEILENMETLRRTSLGTHTHFLPETEIESETFAATHATTLQLANWKEFQTYLFPTLSAAMNNHNKEWEKQRYNVAQKRSDQYYHGIIEKIVNSAFQKTAFTTKHFTTVHWALIDESCTYYEEIIAWIRYGTSMPKTVPKPIRKYFITYKDNLLYAVKEYPKLTGLQEYGFDFVETKLLRSKRLLKKIDTLIEQLKTRQEEQVC